MVTMTGIGTRLVLLFGLVMGCGASVVPEQEVGPGAGNEGAGGHATSRPILAATRASGGTEGTGSNAGTPILGGTGGATKLEEGVRDDAGVAMKRGDAEPVMDAVAPASPVVIVQICGPTGGGPYWVEEGATVTVKLKCSTGQATTGEAFKLGTLPKGATYDVATATLSWKTALDSAGVYLIPVTVNPWKETGELKIGVADKFDDPANVPIKDPNVYTEEFGLPVFHLKPSPEWEANRKIMQMRQLALWDDACKVFCGPSLFAPVTIVHRGKTYKAEGHYRGASTIWSEKPNYTLRFAKDDKFSEPFMGGGRMTKRRVIALINTLDDNSNLRWRMSFELWNRLDPKIIRIEHHSAVVYVNGKYMGLYAVSDKIDDNMMQRAGLAEEGNLYMGMSHQANFDTTVRQEGGPNSGMVRPRACSFEGFTKKEGLPDECDGTKFVPAAYDDLVTFTDFVSKSDDAKFRAGLGTVFDVNDYTAWWIHATATVAIDSFGKNAFHYHDPKTKGPWRAVIWDYNASFGQSYDTTRTAFNSIDPMKFATGTPPVTNNLWRRMLTDPTQGSLMKARYAALLKNEWKVETVVSAFDAFVKEVDASARRDERVWAPLYKTIYSGPTSRAKRTDLTTFSQEVVYMRSWIQMRWGHLKTLFP